jgi:hypothetical protein
MGSGGIAPLTVTSAVGRVSGQLQASPALLPGKDLSVAFK